MRIGSLCSGAGGLDMAVEQVFDATTAWHCELNPAASKVLEYRYPGVPNHHDLINTDWSTVEPIDILCAGWPCQPFSAAGKRKGADDERAIWPYVARAIRILRPRIVVLENVSAVLGPEFQRVANSLAEVGMDVAWTCLRASDVGAPHRRERLFVLAHAEHGTGHRQWSPSEPWQGNPTSVDVVDLLPTPRASDPSNASSHSSPGFRPQLGEVVRELLPTPSTHDMTGARTPAQRGKMTKPFSNLNDAAVNELLPTPNASDGSGGGAHPDRREGHSRQLIDYALLHNTTQWGKYTAAIQRWESLTRPAPSPTEPNKNGNPRLSAAFSEWLMGWPEGWVTDVPGISRNDQLRIVGNGVCPQQAHAALTYLLSLEAAA